MSRYIIYLKGVIPKSYLDIEDAFDAQLLEKVTVVEPKYIPNYNKIPDIFTSIVDWSPKTNICCWYCTFTFETIPVFIPTYINNSNNNLNCGVLGNFCSFSCAQGHINTYYKDSSIYTNNLLKLYYYFNNKTLAKILPSPPLFIMTKYGGSVPPDEYIKDIQFIEKYHVEDYDINRIYIKDEGDYCDTIDEKSNIKAWELT